MDFEECKSGRLRTQDRDCFADIEDPRRGAVVTSSDDDDDDAPLLSKGLRRNVVPRVAGSASVADFRQSQIPLFRESRPNFHSLIQILRIMENLALPIEEVWWWKSLPALWLQLQLLCRHQTLSSLWECLRLIL